MTTPFESAMAKLAAIETWPTLTHSQQMTIAVVPALTPSEARALRERLEWRPIETRPEEYEDVIVVDEDQKVRVGYADDVFGWFALDRMGEVEIIRPTAWQPLPPPPAKEPTL